MYFLSAEPLIEKFRTGKFDDSAVFPYFMANVILSVGPLGASGTSAKDGWDVTWWLLSILIAIMGVLHLRTKNGGDFSDQFLAKYFCFNWIIVWRIGLVFLTVVFPLAFLIATTVGPQAWKPVLFVTGIAFQIFYYRLLGSLIAQSRRQEDAEPERMQGTVL